MPLFINSKPLPNNVIPSFINSKPLPKNCKLLQIVTKDPFLLKTASTFLSTTCTIGCRSFYLFQRERATIGPEFGFEWVGSTEATTCCIVLLRSPVTKKVSVGHLDGTISKENLLGMVSSFNEVDTSEGLETHLVGGYSDENKIAKPIIRGILETLHNCTLRFHLRTAFVQDLNTKSESGLLKPCVQGAAIHIATGEVVAVSSFLDRGPDIPLRTIRSFLGEEHLEDIFHAETGCLSLGPYSYSLLNDASDLLLLSDSELLQCSSTSPNVEGPNFVTDMRQALLWLLENPNWVKFFGGKPRRYCYGESGWRRIQN